jgi:hypothetical protein
MDVGVGEPESVSEWPKLGLSGSAGILNEGSLLILRLLKAASRFPAQFMPVRLPLYSECLIGGTRGSAERTLAPPSEPPGVAPICFPRDTLRAAGGQGGGWPTGPRARRPAGRPLARVSCCEPPAAASPGRSGVAAGASGGAGHRTDDRASRSGCGSEGPGRSPPRRCAERGRSQQARARRARAGMVGRRCSRPEPAHGPLYRLVRGARLTLVF